MTNVSEGTDHRFVFETGPVLQPLTAALPLTGLQRKGCTAQWSAGAAALHRLVTHNRSLQCSAVTRGTAVVQSWKLHPTSDIGWSERASSPPRNIPVYEKGIVLLSHMKTSVDNIIISITLQQTTTLETDYSPASFWNHISSKCKTSHQELWDLKTWWGQLLHTRTQGIFKLWEGSTGSTEASLVHQLWARFICHVWRNISDNASYAIIKMQTGFVVERWYWRSRGGTSSSHKRKFPFF